MHTDPAQFAEFCTSSGFAQLCASRWPNEWAAIAQSGAWHDTSPNRLHSVLEQYPVTDFAHALRRWRQLNAVRIAWRDISGQADFPQTCVELSALADECQQLALTQAQERLQQRYGVLEPECRFCVIALGKLGAGELNFSSDIDVLFVYQGRGQTQGRRSLEESEYFTKLAQDWISLLDRISEHGQVYRVDTRLRPFGRAGALCWSLSALEDYYQREGRDWERFAWLRARPVAGDLALGERLIQALRPFVFRRYLDYGLFEGVRAIRAEIERESQRQGRQDHLKLGPGGIRELEFLVQSHQILRGGQLAPLRQRNTLAALQACAELGLIDTATAQRLSQAYQFLRTLENRLQMLDDQQVHELPRQAAQQQRLARLLGCSWTQLLEQLQPHQACVHAEFRRLFQEPVSAGSQWQELSELKLEPEQIQTRLQQLGFTGPRAWQLLHDHHQALQRLPLSSEARQRLSQFHPRLLQVISQRHAADRLLQHCLDLVQQVARRSAYLALLLENPAALERMVDLFARSDTVFHWVREQPSLLDDLIAPTAVSSDAEVLQSQLRARLGNQDDGERQQELLLRSQHSLRLNSAITELSAAPEQAAAQALQAQASLSALAQAVIATVLGLQADLPAVAECGFAIIAYGALGAAEMRYGSDLDLVFLYASERMDEARATRLARRIIHWLSTPGPGGRLYPIDTRLRPNGNRGLLVSSLNAFHDYQCHHAWTWEIQALARARPIAGDQALAQAFHSLRRERLAQVRDPAVLAAEFHSMRSKMRSNQGREALSGEAMLKHGPGGMVDIQFLAQYWQLLYSACAEPISAVQNTLALLQTLSHSPHLSTTVRTGAAELAQLWPELVQQRHSYELNPHAIDPANGVAFGVELARAADWYQRVFSSSADA